MGLKRWIYAQSDTEAAKKLQQMVSEQIPDISYLAARILQGRGYTAEEALQLLQEGVPLPDPFQMVDMDKAAERIQEAIEEEERIAVYGDYDCDGVTATALLCGYLESNGADVMPYIPTREDGYGLNKAAIRYLWDMGITLLITVDNGISAVEEIAYATELGMDVVVTDHHQPPEVLPKAAAIVDPHRKDCPSQCRELAGVGVAFQLARALEEDETGELLEYYGMLAAIGTIADVVPLTGVNRTIVRRGLQQIAAEPSAGIAALLEKAGLAGKPVTSSSVAFGIAPRINAAGRIGDASAALQLLMADDYETALSLAEQVDEANRSRRELEQKVMTDISAQFQKKPSASYQRVLVLEGEGWHHGVIGIAASRLTERSGKPCILVSREADGSGRGSARSVEGFSMIQAVTACSSPLTRFGGHPMAAGMSVEKGKFAEFQNLFQKYAAQTYPEMPVYTVRVDAVLSQEDLSLESIRSLSLLEPFGTNNEIPVFAIQGAVIGAVSPIGEGKHLRLRLTQGDGEYQAVYFGMTVDQFPYQTGDKVDALVSVEINSYNGQERLSIKIKEMRLSQLDQEGWISGQLLYEKLCRKEMITPQEAERAAPTRDETAVVYRFLREQKQWSGTEEQMYARLCGKFQPGSGFQFCKMRVALMALFELGLIQRDSRTKAIIVPAASGKVDLTSAGVLQRIQKMSGEAQTAHKQELNVPVAAGQTNGGI